MTGFTDYIHNGRGHGAVGQFLEGCYFDPGYARPYLDKNGNAAVTINTGRWTVEKGVRRPIREHRLVRDLVYQGKMHPVLNATTLPRDAWIQIDANIRKATRQRLNAWEDLKASSTVGGFDAMGKMTFEYQAMNDPGEAVVSMDAVADARTDRPLFTPTSIPLPITHSEFFFTAREIAVAKNGNMPLDTAMGEAAGRRCAEMVERTTIGTETGVTFGTQSSGILAHRGTSTVYGYTNFPYRVTKTDLHTPVTTAPENVIEDIIEMRETMYTNGYFGPFMVYHSTGYDRFFDDDYFRTGGTAVTRTLRERIGSIDGIQGIKRLDYLTSGYQLVMVDMNSETAQAINGMEITTLQYESKGGLRINFVVMCIQVPLLRAPYNGVAGIIHGTTS